MRDTTSTTRSICETFGGELHLTDWPLANDLILGRESAWSTNDSLHATVSIGMLNDDVHVVIFDFCQLTDEYDGSVDVRPRAFKEIAGGTGIGQLERLWYKLTQAVCKIWRSLILAPPYRLNLHFFCTEGTPVAEMLSIFCNYNS